MLASLVAFKVRDIRDDHTKSSKPDKDKYHMISLTCGIQKNDTSELIYKTKIDSQTWMTNLWLP